MSHTRGLRFIARPTAVQLLPGPKVGMLTLRCTSVAVWLARPAVYERQANPHRKETLLGCIHAIGDSTDDVCDNLELVQSTDSAMGHAIQYLGSNVGWIASVIRERREGAMSAVAGGECNGRVLKSHSASSLSWIGGTDVLHAQQIHR